MPLLEDIFDRYQSIYLISENEGETVGGPAIDALFTELSRMHSMGEPKEWNDMGFNKRDWNWYVGLISKPEHSRTILRRGSTL